MLHRLIRVSAAAGLLGCIAVVLGCKGGKPQMPPPPPPKVTVAKTFDYPVQGYQEYNGYLDPVEKFEARARVKGFLTEVNFTEGEEVKAGALLYRIDPREYEASLAKSIADIAKAEADIANANAQIKLGDSELARAEESYKRGAAAKTDLDKAVANAAANRAQLDVAVANKAASEAARDTAQLQLDFTEIKSPIDGRISRTLVTKGNLVGQTDATLLTTVVSVDPLYVMFDVPERDLIEAQKTLQSRPKSAGPPPVTPLEIGVATEEGYPHPGFLDFRDNRADPGTGTIRLRGRVPNPASAPNNARLLYPGVYARVRVPRGESQSRPVIPEDALMTGQEGRYVYVVGTDNKVAKRVVKVGTQVYRMPQLDDGKTAAWMLNNPNPPPPPAPGSPPRGGPPLQSKIPVRSVVAIEKGLKAGDTIVVDGLQKARPGSEVAPEMWEFLGPTPPTAKK